MLRKAVFAVALLCAETVVAEYTDFYFSTNATNLKCRDSGSPCEPPNVCAHDTVTDAHYCCMPGATDAVCWINSNDCRGNNKGPAGGQIGCASNAGPNAYCCRDNREQCTQRSGQINVCWAKAENPMAGISSSIVNKVYSSKSKASASAATLTVSLAQFSTSSSLSSGATTSAPSSSGSSSSSASSSSSSSSSSGAPLPAPPGDDSSSSISGGAIGGIVVGAVAGLALIGTAIFLILRRRTASKGAASKPVDDTSELSGGPNPYVAGYSAVAQGPPQTKYAYGADGHFASEAPGDTAFSNHGQMPAEMPAGSYGAPMELDGTTGGHNKPAQLP